MTNDPMSLKNLPAQLKAMKESGNTDSIMVNTGQITDTESNFTKWSKKFALAASLFMAITVGGFMTYDSVSTKQYTVIVDTNHGANLSQLISDSGGQLVSVTEKNGSYEVTINSTKSRRSFLQWFRKNKEIRSAE